VNTDRTCRPLTPVPPTTFGTPAEPEPIPGSVLADQVWMTRLVASANQQVDVWDGHDYIGTYRLTAEDIDVLRDAEFTVRPAAPVRPAMPKPGGLVRAIFDAAAGKAPF